jgi:4-diphosphocytidyl-2-C-methyl-D-erythritol kinase
MVVFPNAKINIGLNIVERRPDGYHNIESVFYPINIYDRMQVDVDEESEIPACTLTLDGIEIEGKPEENLVVRAYQLLAQDRNLPAVKVKLTKLIPMGAGLGGGSSDAAFMLKTLNELFELQLSDDVLEAYAARLGADCAFFIKNKPMYATGIGNIFSDDVPIPSLTGKTLVLVKPNVFVSTREAYSMIVPAKPKNPLSLCINQPISSWKETIYNDFEASVFPKFPLIKQVKETLYELGAVYASMSGSGSSVFGIFENPVEIEDEFSDMFVIQNTF